MALTLLAIVQDLCRKQGVQVPSSVIANTDEQFQQMYALLVEETHELGMRLNWQGRLRKKAAFQHQGGTGGPPYSALSIYPEDFPFIRKILPDTMWETHSIQRVRSIQSWEAFAAYGAQAIVPTSPYIYFIMNRWLCIAPVPTVLTNASFTFMFMSGAHWVGDDGDTEKYEPDADTDVPLLPSTIIKAGLKWRWKNARGLPYAEDFRSYELMITQWGSGEQAQEAVSMDGGDKDFLPGVFVPTFTNIGQ